MLVNLDRDRVRRAGRRVIEAEWDESAAAACSLEDPGDAPAGREAMIAALGRLSHRQREVLVLRFYADLSVAETAAATGASEGTVKSYTSRGLARLRELLAEPCVVEVCRDQR